MRDPLTAATRGWAIGNIRRSKTLTEGLLSRHESRYYLVDNGQMVYRVDLRNSREVRRALFDYPYSDELWKALATLNGRKHAR